MAPEANTLVPMEGVKRWGELLDVLGDMSLGSILGSLGGLLVAKAEQKDTPITSAGTHAVRVVARSSFIFVFKFTKVHRCTVHKLPIYFNIRPAVWDVLCVCEYAQLVIYRAPLWDL